MYVYAFLHWFLLNCFYIERVPFHSEVIGEILFPFCAVRVRVVSALAWTIALQYGCALKSS